MSEVLQSVLNICPGCDHRAKYHEAEGEKRHAGNGATEPEDFTIGDQNDCQVLEDGIDRDREKLESFGTGINHNDESERHGKP